MPMALRPRFFAATSVVPLPMKGSRMVWDKSVDAWIIFAKSHSGFGVGCPFASAIGPRNTGDLHNSLNVAPLRLPNTQYSILLNQRYSPFIGLGLLFSQMQSRTDMPASTKASRISLICPIPHHM